MLQTKDLGIGYPKKIILENLNLTLEKGKLTALLGINGAGKSTLLKTLAGVNQSLFGEVLLDNKSIKKYLKKEIAKKISLVLTEQAATKRLTVKELISLGRYPYTGWSNKAVLKDQKIIDWAIEAVGMQGLADVPIGELSDGLRQKTMIGRALAQEGDILILDEPTAHLDLVNRSEVMMLLSDLAVQFGKAILVSTHELDLILQVAHRLWLISDKKIHTGITEKLVLNGEIAKAFAHPPIYFDREKGNFKIQKEKANTSSYLLKGHLIGCYWTKIALEKQGINAKIISSEENNIQKNIIFVERKSDTTWKWKVEQEEYTDLSNFLERMKYQKHF